MARRYSLKDAGKRLAELVAEAERGEEVVIERDGAPSVRLVVIERAKLERHPGTAKGMFQVPDDFDEPLPPDILGHFR